MDSTDSGQALRYLSESLRALIRANIPEFQSESSIVFGSPSELENPDATTLVLYLYHIDHNPYLRNLPPTLTRRAGTPESQASLLMVKPPLVIDAHYMMVPYAKSAELELVLSDKIASLFHRFSALRGDLLAPQLRQMGNLSIDIVAQNATFDTMRNLWSGFHHKPYKRTSLYTLSPLRIPAADAMQADMVTDAAIALAPDRVSATQAGAGVTAAANQ